MKIFECLQYSPEWWQLRLTVPTASCFDRILTPKTMKPSAQQEDYICELIGDLIAPTAPFFTEREGHTAAMRNGINTEPEARRWYEMECGLDVRQVGFIKTDDDRFGASPDGLILGIDGNPIGGLELKCPLPKTQVKYLVSGDLPDEYKWQVHGSLIVSGLSFWDFVSYCPGLEPLRIRVEPDKDTEALKAELEKFWVKYQKTLAAVRAKG